MSIARTPPLLRTAPRGWGGLPFLVNEAPRPLGGCVELQVLGSPQASTHASFLSPDRPVCGGPVRAHLPGLELLLVHHHHARHHGPLHHSRCSARGHAGNREASWWGFRAPPPIAWDLASLSQAHGPLQLLSQPGCCVHLCKGKGHGCGTFILSRARLPPHSSPVEARPLQLSFSLAGGLTAVIYTDALQTLVMVVGAVILTIKGEGHGPIQ